MKQHIFSFDLKQAAAAFQAQCARQGVQGRARGAYLRTLILAQEDALAAAQGAALPKPLPPEEGALAVVKMSAGYLSAPPRGAERGARKEIRTTVTPEAYERLVAAVTASNTKSLAKYLEVVATNAVPVETSPSAPIGQLLSPEAMHEISTIGRELMAIGRNVNQIAKSLHLHPGKTTEKDREALRALPSTIHRGMNILSTHLLSLSPPRYARMRARKRIKKA